MTWHKTAARFKPFNTDWSKRTFGPYEAAPVSGTYFCTGCMQEISRYGGEQFPPVGHHGHGESACPVRWRLKCGDD